MVTTINTTMRIFMNIIESLSSPLPVTWHDRSGEGITAYNAEFQIDDGLFVVRMINLHANPGYWEVSFVRNGDYGLSGTGNAQAVMATVLATLRTFIKEVDPRFIEIEMKNDELSRHALYERLAKNLIREFPEYAIHRKKTGSKYTGLVVKRADRPYVAPEPPKREEIEEMPPMTDEEWAELEKYFG